MCIPNHSKLVDCFKKTAFYLSPYKQKRSWKVLEGDKYYNCCLGCNKLKETLILIIWLLLYSTNWISYLRTTSYYSSKLFQCNRMKLWIKETEKGLINLNILKWSRPAETIWNVTSQLVICCCFFYFRWPVICLNLLPIVTNKRSGSVHQRCWIIDANHSKHTQFWKRLY